MIDSDPTITAKETFHLSSAIGNPMEMLQWSSEDFKIIISNPHAHTQIRKPTVFDIRCNDIDITQGVPPWFDIGPHRIDNFPLKNGSCWSFNDYISESYGLNDFPVIALSPVFLRFVKGSRILFVYQWHSVHSNNINLICCSGFFWVYSFKVISLLFFLHFLRSIFFRHQRKKSGVYHFWIFEIKTFQMVPHKV